MRDRCVQRLARLAALVGAVAAAGSCRVRGGSLVEDAVAADNARAVQVAITAMEASTPAAARLGLRVHEFRRDSLGYLITLIPADERVVGGGARIHVARHGPATIIERYQ